MACKVSLCPHPYGIISPIPALSLALSLLGLLLQIIIVDPLSSSILPSAPLYWQLTQKIIPSPTSSDKNKIV